MDTITNFDFYEVVEVSAFGNHEVLVQNYMTCTDARMLCHRLNWEEDPGYEEFGYPRYQVNSPEYVGEMQEYVRAPVWHRNRGGIYHAETGELAI